jgi:transposase
VHEDNKFAPGSVAERALHRIAELYAIESSIRGQLPRNDNDSGKRVRHRY